MDKLIRADSLGFLRSPGKLPLILAETPLPAMQILHATSVPPTPFMDDFCNAFITHKNFTYMATVNPSIREVDAKSDLDGQGLGVVFGMHQTPDDMTRERVRTLADAGLRIMTLVYAGSSAY